MKHFNSSLLLLCAILGLVGCSSQAPEVDSCLIAEDAAPTLETARQALKPAEVPALKAWLARQDSGWQPRARGRRHAPASLHLLLRRGHRQETHLAVVGNTIWMQDRWKALDTAELEELWRIIGPSNRVRHLRAAVWAM